MSGILVAPTFVSMVNLRDVNDAAKADQKGLVWDAATSRHVYVDLVVPADLSSYLSTADIDTLAELNAVVADDTIIGAAATDASSFGFVVDEDNLASNLDTKVPTQQSVKAYVDSVVAGLTALEAEDIDTLAEINAIIGDATLVTVEATDASGYGWVIDEDNMASDSATKVPTQQSVKAYVDASGASLPVVDTTGIAKGSVDATKIVRLEVDGLTTGTTRVLTVQDADGTIALLGGDVWSGAHDFGGADSLEIPNGAAPTVDAAGEIAVDTTITDMTGFITYHDGTEQLYAIAVPTAQLASPTDKDAAVYSAADNEFQLQGVVTPYQLNGDTLGGELSGDMVVYDTDHWENLRAGNEHDRLEIRSGVPTWFPRYASTTVSDGATVTVDQSVGDEFKVTLGGNRTLALTNPTLDQSVMLRVIQDGTGSRTLSFPASVKWPGGTAPTLTTTAGASDWIGFKCVNASTPVYHGFIVGQGYSA